MNGCKKCTQFFGHLSAELSQIFLSFFFGLEMLQNYFFLGFIFIFFVSGFFGVSFFFFQWMLGLSFFLSFVSFLRMISFFWPLVFFSVVFCHMPTSDVVCAPGYYLAEDETCQPAEPGFPLPLILLIQTNSFAPSPILTSLSLSLSSFFLIKGSTQLEEEI